MLVIFLQASLFSTVQRAIIIDFIDQNPDHLEMEMVVIAGLTQIGEKVFRLK